MRNLVIEHIEELGNRNDGFSMGTMRFNDWYWNPRYNTIFKLNKKSARKMKSEGVVHISEFRNFINDEVPDQELFDLLIMLDRKCNRQM